MTSARRNKIKEFVINPIVPGAVKNAKTEFLRRPIFDKMS